MQSFTSLKSKVILQEWLRLRAHLGLPCTHELEINIFNWLSKVGHMFGDTCTEPQQITDNSDLRWSKSEPGTDTKLGRWSPVKLLLIQCSAREKPLSLVLESPWKCE